MEMSAATATPTSTPSLSPASPPTSSPKKAAKKAGPRGGNEEGAAEFAQVLGQNAGTAAAEVRIQPDAEAQGKALQAQMQMHLQAQAGLQSKAQAQPAPAAVPPKGTASAAAKPEAAQANLAGKSGLMMQSTAERVPATMKAATSLNTGSTIAGLKPWSNDWIFQGDEPENPELRSVLQKSPAEVMSERMAQAQSSRAKGGMPPAKAPAARGEGAQIAASGANPEAELMAKLMALNAAIEEISGQEGAEPGGQALRAGPSGVKAMSGDDFLALAALNDPRFGQRQAGQQLGSGQQQFDGQPGQDPGARGELKLVGKGARELGPKPGGRPPEPLWDPGQAASAGVAAAGQPHAFGAGRPLATEVTGHVVKGSMAKDRLSTDSLVGIGGGIRSLSQQGGGEMRVRLNPDNLGELHLRVTTQGNQVGLQIQASDERAKKILEDSLTHLKESLASQSLSLAKVDVTVAHAAGHSSGLGGQGQSDSQPSQSWNQPNAQAFDGLMRQDLSQGGGQNHARQQYSEAAGDHNRASAVPRSGLSSMSGVGVESGARVGASRAAAGRLDLHA